ncbi:hypothetical protein AYY26_12780 [Photobacterium phosphoreum]|jgi:magnesium transporter|nr:magnesium transporter [Photobacterium phosphoreum]MCD9510581.1 CBS domain-containing protein [Photobacterium phosphoreum]MCD9517826.1 CBS domain-containing protein [Photobacterium phosphoreum]OBU46914.1 hypothetical protein AYY26_12780 [Photobacterium phosphoreum]PSU67134.1 magnesium transporter [Photobacterium phosphoreum]
MGSGIFNMTTITFNKQKIHTIFFSHNKDNIADLIDLIHSNSHSHIEVWFNKYSLKYAYEIVCQLPTNYNKKLKSLLPASFNLEFDLLDKANDPVIKKTSEVVPLVFHTKDAVTDVVRYLKDEGRTDIIFVVDDNGCHIGIVTASQLMLANGEELLANIVTPSISCSTNTDQEKAAIILQKEDVNYLPVVNIQGQPVAIVEAKNVINIVQQEQTEDLELMMGIQQSDSKDLTYLQTSVMDHVRKRIFWIVGLAGVGIISGIIIQSYDDAIAAMTVLALYMPMVADTGGNAGSQSATVIVRALALNQLKLNDWLRVVWKELRISVFIGLGLAAASCAKVLLLSHNVSLPSGVTLKLLALAIALALFLQVLTATLIGAILPLLAKKSHVDPAVVASPAITTIVDISGMLIYFYCTTTILGLS